MFVRRARGEPMSVKVLDFPLIYFTYKVFLTRGIDQVFCPWWATGRGVRIL